MLTLYKDRAVEQTRSDARDRAVSRIAQENQELAASLERFQRTVDGDNAPPESHVLFGEVERLRAENDALRAAYDRVTAWRRWKVMRPARFVYRRVKRWRG